MHPSLLLRPVLAIALVLLIGACSRPTTSTVQAGSGIEVRLSLDLVLASQAPIPSGTRLRWIDLDTRETGEGVMGEEPGLRLPISTLLLLAVESEGAPNDGWLFELVDTDRLRATAGVMPPAHSVTPLRRVQLDTGDGPSGSEVRVECDTLERVAPIDDELCAAIETLLVDDWDVSPGTVELPEGLAAALRTRLSTRVRFAEGPSVLGAHGPSTAIAARSDLRPAFVPDSTIDVLVVENEKLYLRLAAPVDGAYAPIDKGRARHHGWHLLPDNVVAARRQGESIEARLTGGDERISGVLEVPPIPAPRATVRVELPVDAGAIPGGVQVDVFATRTPDGRTHWLRGIHAATGNAVDVRVDEDVPALLVASWAEDGVTVHAVLRSDLEPGGSAITADAWPSAESAAFRTTVDVAPSCFTDLERDLGGTHEVLIRTAFHNAHSNHEGVSNDGTSRASSSGFFRFEFGIAAAVPGRHLFIANHAGLEAESVMAFARVGDRSLSPMVDLVVEESDRGVAIAPHPFDLEGHPQQVVRFTLPADAQAGAYRGLATNVIARRGSMRFTAFTPIHELTDRSIAFRRDAGDWARMRMVWTDGRGVAYVATTLGNGSDVPLHHVEFRRAVRATARIPGTAIEGWDREWIDVYGPWTLAEVEASDPGHPGQGLHISDDTVARGDDGEVELSGLERGGTYTLVPSGTGHRANAPRIVFEVPSDLSGDTLDLGLLRWSEEGPSER